MRWTLQSLAVEILRVRSFGVIRIRISDPRSLGSWCIKGSDEAVGKVDSSVPLMHHDPSDTGSLILIRITPKERTLRLTKKYFKPSSAMEMVESSWISRPFQAKTRRN